MQESKDMRDKNIKRAARGIPKRISRLDWGVLKLAPMAGQMAAM
jgi:hypothetical protein